MKITREKCNDIAIKILSNNFGVYGRGNFDLFDLSVDKFAEVLFIAINEDDNFIADGMLTNYYNSIK